MKVTHEDIEELAEQALDRIDSLRLDFDAPELMEVGPYIPDLKEALQEIRDSANQRTDPGTIKLDAEAARVDANNIVTILNRQLEGQMAVPFPDREKERRLSDIKETFAEVFADVEEINGIADTLDRKRSCVSCGRRIALEVGDKLARRFRELRIRAADLAFDLDVPARVEDGLKLLSRQIGAFVEWLEGDAKRKLDSLGIRYRGKERDELIGASLKAIKNTAAEVREDAQRTSTRGEVEPIEHLYEDIYTDQMKWIKGQL